MKDLMGLMKQAKDMQKKMESAQELVADLTAIGRSGGGLVTVTLAGGGNMKSLEIDPSLLTRSSPSRNDEKRDGRYSNAARDEAAVLN